MSGIQKGVLTSVGAAVLAVAVAAAQTPAPQSRAGFSLARLAMIPLALQQAVDAGEIPGVVTLIWRKGELVQFNAVGLRSIERKLPMERNTIFRIASMSKPITSVAALILVEEGKLALSDPITKWLPEFANMRVLRHPDGPLDDTYPAPRAITIEDLLTQRAGIVYSYLAPNRLRAELQQAAGGIGTPFSHDQWTRTLAALPLVSAPGERFQYGYSTDLLGVIVGKAAGTSFRQFLLDRVAGPLGMIDTDFWIPPAKRDRAAEVYAPDPGGKRFRRVDIPSFLGAAPPVFTSGGEGLVSTADDYLKFARMLVRGGEENGARLLKPETVRRMLTNHLTPAHRALPFLGTPMWKAQGFGLGVSMITDPQASAVPGAGSEGAFTWPGAFGGWWQGDPAHDLVAVFLPQLLPAPPSTSGPPSLADLVPAAKAMATFQRLVYAALE